MALDRIAARETDIRRAVGHFASGVVVITTVDSAQPIGMTATAFCSVSSAAGLVLTCVNRANRTLTPILESHRYGINVLASPARHISDYCAQPGRLKSLRPNWLDGAVWTSPALRDALAFLDCRLEHTFDAGTHTVLIGAVSDLGVAEDSDQQPLVHFRSNYRFLETARIPSRLMPLPVVLEES